MTRKPIVFIRGPQSPFYFAQYWNGIPRYLREHGYEVYEVSWHNLKNYDWSAITPHWIFDESCPTSIETIIENCKSSLFKVRFTENKNKPKIFDRLHAKYTNQDYWTAEHLGAHDTSPHQTAKAILKHAIQLAESEQ